MDDSMNLVSNDMSALSLNLLQLLRHNTYSHTAYVMVRKEVILPIAERLYELATSRKECPLLNSEECWQYNHMEDLRVASDTIDRLMYYSKDPNCMVSADEATNLRNILLGNYTKEMKDDRL